MAKKKKKTKTKQVYDSKEQFLLHLIDLSEKQIDGKHTSLDELFKAQANRLKKELKEYKENKNGK